MKQQIIINIECITLLNTGVFQHTLNENTKLLHKNQEKYRKLERKDFDMEPLDARGHKEIEHKKNSREKLNRQLENRK